MPAWIKPIEPCEIVDGELYFVALKPVSKNGRWMFWSEPKSGKRQFSVKPGIALKYEGSKEFRAYIQDKPEFCAVQIPSDYNTKWRARK